MIVAGLVGEHPALAEGPTQATQAKTTTLTATQKAKQHYLKGEAYFKAHAFSAAMGEYLSGYEEKPDPVFIFNVAQCQRLLGHHGPALRSYRRYLVEAPEGAGRAIAEKQVAELERLVAGRDSPYPSAVTEVFGPAPTSSVSPASAAPSAPPSAPVSGTVATVQARAAPPEVTLALVPVRSAATVPIATPAAFVTTSARASSSTSALLVMHTAPEPRPIYERWWFWSAAGAVSVFAVVAIASAGGRPGCEAGRSCR